jgi:hypothetical protein
MNPIKILENLVKIKDELRETRLKIEHYERQIDYSVSEMIEFLKHKRIIESRTIG